MASTQFSLARRVYTGDAVTQETGITFCGWVKPTAVSPWGAMLAFGDLILNAGSSAPNNLKVSFWSGGAALDSLCPVTTTAWLFWAVTWEGAAVRLRVSSDFETIAYDVTTNKASTWTIDSFEVGDYFNSFERYNGQIHHLRVFAAVLSDAEVLAEMASETAVATAWAAWELNDASLVDVANGRNLTGASGTVSVGAESAPVPEPPPPVTSSVVRRSRRLRSLLSPQRWQ